MKIGIDLHGVLDKHPELMKPLMESLIKDHEVWIISGPPFDQIERELSNLGYKKWVHYHLIYSVVGYLKSKGVKMWQDDKGDWWCDNDLWWSSKSKICFMIGIDILLDDSVKYSPYFKDMKTKFILLKGE
jgi:hypothetical protein